MNRNIKIALMVGLVLVVGAGIALAGTGRNGWLGVYTEEVDRDIVKALDLSVKRGAIVNEVIDDSPADKAGITEDDVIIAIDDEKVYDDDDLQDLIQDHRPGDDVVITIIRDGNEKKIDVTLGRRKSSSSWSWVSGRGDHGKSRKHYSTAKNRYFQQFSFNDERPYIGVVMYELNEQLAEFFAADRGGVLITEVVEDSPAEEAGLKAGDVIVGINGESIEYTEDISDVIGDMDEGDLAKIDILRDRKTMQIEVTVALRDDGLYGSIDPIHINIPEIRNIGMHIPQFHNFGHGSYFLDSDEWEEEMEDLQEELEDLHEELEDLHESLH